MVHVPKLQIRGATYHVMARGNRKQPIFKDYLDRWRFNAIGEEVAAEYEVRILADSQMTTHFHKVVTTPRGNISRYMQQLQARYAKYVNRRHKHVGHLFQGPFKRVIIEDDMHLLTEIAYVLLNPVKGGIVRRIDQWKWCSYKATMGRAAQPASLNLEWLQILFGGGTLEESRRRFYEFIHSDNRLQTYLDQQKPAIGTPRFESVIRSFIGEKFYGVSVPRAYRGLARPPLTELLIPGQSRSERNTMIRRAQVVHGYTLAEIGRCLNLHPASVSRIVCRLRNPQ